MRDRGYFAGLEPAWSRAFELAWESWCAGSFGIGAVVVNDSGETGMNEETGQIVSEGRNRVLEDDGGGRQLGGSLLAHAEMDALVGLRLRTGAGLTVLTTVEPCLMCTATLASIRVAGVVFASPDPLWSGMSELLAADARLADRIPPRRWLGQRELSAFAGMLPFAFRAWSQPDAPSDSRWVRSQPGLWEAGLQLVASGILQELRTAAASVEEAIEVTAPTLSACGALDSTTPGHPTEQLPHAIPENGVTT